MPVNKNTAKATANKEVEATQVEATTETASETKAEPKAVEFAPEPRKLTGETQIEVMNNTGGRLGWTSPRTQAVYMFENFGDSDFMQLSELQTMRNHHPAYFQNSWLKVMDEDAVKFLRLERLYKDTLESEDLMSLFTNETSIEDFEETLKNAKPALKSLISSKARELYEAGEFDSSRKIKILDEYLGLDLTVLED